MCPWRFAGQYRDDETGLHYDRFRYYDALGSICRETRWGCARRCGSPDILRTRASPAIRSGCHRRRGRGSGFGQALSKKQRDQLTTLRAGGEVEVETFE